MLVYNVGGPGANGYDRNSAQSAVIRPRPTMRNAQEAEESGDRSGERERISQGTDDVSQTPFISLLTEAYI